MNKLVCITGMPGSGKSVLSDYFTQKGYQFVRFGQVVLDEVKKRNLPLSEENERKIREEIRIKHGMAAMAILNYPKFSELMKKGNVIGDGLYSWAEYKFLKEKFGDQMVTIAVYAPPKLRYKWLSQRILLKEDKDLRNRPLSLSDAMARDYAEIEKLDKGGPIAMSDYTLLNTSDKECFLKQVEELFKEVEG